MKGSKIFAEIFFRDIYVRPYIPIKLVSRHDLFMEDYGKDPLQEKWIPQQDGRQLTRRIPH